MSPSPTMRRKQLGAQLRRFRNQAKVTVEDAAHELGCSPAKVRHIENGRNSIRKPELTVLLGLYGVDPDAHEVLEETRQEASRQGWWSTYRLPSWLHAYVGMETDARTMRNFELELIPGLLQTEGYARAVHVLAKHMTEPAEVERKVAARLRRQQRLDQDDPLTLHAIISEAALHRIAGTGLGEEQLRHLLVMADKPNVTINVLPFSAGLHESMSGSFVLLDFDPDVSLPVAFQEYAVGGHLVDDQDVVARLSTVFADLMMQALDQNDSAKLISEMIKEMR